MNTDVEDAWRRAVDTHPEAARTCLTALLLDDDPVDAGLVSRLVKRSSQFEVALTTCRTAEEAAAMLSTTKFDVALIDYWLGQETSISFIREQSHSRDTACVLLTGLDVPDIRRCAFRAGAVGYLAKDNLSI